MEDLGNYRPESLTLGSNKVMEQIFILKVSSNLEDFMNPFYIKLGISIYIYFYR